MKSCCHRSAYLLELITEAEQQIGAVADGDAYALYELLRQIASRIGSSESFYVAQYSSSDQMLFFPFNVDEGIYHEPIIVAMGNGPTSWVVRHRKPFVLDEENWTIHNGNINFGDSQRVSQSAIHVPMRIFKGAEQEVIGVLSTQSYQAQADDELAVQTLQWLADRAAAVLYHEQQVALWHERVQVAEARISQWQPQAVALSNKFVQLIKAVSDKADALQKIVSARPTPVGSSLKGDDKAWHDKLLRSADDLSRECKRTQTQANLLPLQFRKPSEAFVTTESTNSAPSLSAREHEIMVLLSRGFTNRAIAKHLVISLDTVKFHCSNAYSKLGVHTRLEAVQRFSALSSSNPSTSSPES